MLYNFSVGQCWLVVRTDLCHGESAWISFVFSLDTHEISHCCSMSTEAHTKYTIHRSEMEGMLLAFLLTIDLRRNARKACDEDGEVHVSSGVARLLFMVI